MTHTIEFIEKAQESLSRFKRSGKFNFGPNDQLGEVCNAPHDAGGIYLIIGNSGSRRELYDIGHSGRILENGDVDLRKDGFRGRFLSGKEKGIPGKGQGSRNKVWPQKIDYYSVSQLEIHWYVTLDSQNEVCPKVLKNELVNSFVGQFGHKPEWKKML